MRAILIIALLTAPSLAQAGIPVGHEQEYGAGIYGKLLYHDGGWSVWRIETRSTTACKAVFAGGSDYAPEPIGVGSEMVGGTPRVEANIRRGRVYSLDLRGKWLRATVKEYRLSGERFWRGWGSGPKLASVQDRRIDVRVVSWEYPNILAGREDEIGTIDLTGLSAAIAAAREC